MNQTSDKNKNLIVSLSKSLSFPLIHIQGGTFDMGSKEYKDEQPIHSVTQALYEAITGENPSYFQGTNRPVEQVSWNDAQAFIQALNTETGKTFRLPSEAEWEFAARGGIYAQGYAYCGSDQLKQVGWYSDNSGNETKPVGLLLPNELGLYDMSGNVYEWCEDDYHGDYKKAPKDGSPWVDSPERGAYRVRRGGSCFNRPIDCRPADRSSWRPVVRGNGFGFRLVLSLQSVG
jgi:sulfatase modifying factor 1